MGPGSSGTGRGGDSRLGSFRALDPWTLLLSPPGDPPLPKRRARPFFVPARDPLWVVRCLLGNFSTPVRTAASRPLSLGCDLAEPGRKEGNAIVGEASPEPFGGSAERTCEIDPFDCGQRPLFVSTALRSGVLLGLSRSRGRLSPSLRRGGWGRCSGIWWHLAKQKGRAAEAAKKQVLPLSKQGCLPRVV